MAKRKKSAEQTDDLSVHNFSDNSFQWFTFNDKKAFALENFKVKPFYNKIANLLGTSLFGIMKFFQQRPLNPLPVGESLNPDDRKIMTTFGKIIEVEIDQLLNFIDSLEVMFNQATDDNDEKALSSVKDLCKITVKGGKEMLGEYHYHYRGCWDRPNKLVNRLDEVLEYLLIEEEHDFPFFQDRLETE